MTSSSSCLSSRSMPFYLHPDFSSKLKSFNQLNDELYSLPGITIPNRQRFDSTSDFSSYSSSTSLSSSLSGYSLGHASSDTESLTVENSSSNNTDCSFQVESNLTNHTKLQQEFMAQVCGRVETRIKQLTICTELTQLFWVYLCEKLSLNPLLATLGSPDESQNFKVQLEFFQNLNKLMQCLHLIESELDRLAANGSVDSQLVIEITFLVYEEANAPISNSLLVFEQKVNQLLKYLPVLSTLVMPIEKKLFKELINSNESNECGICAAPIDVGEILLKPNVNEEKATQPEANPITQSYSCLINNLNALSMITHDPISEAYDVAQETGCEADIVSMACLNISYYTMGLFELKKSLFENKFQFLYELDQFYADFNHMFSNDTYCAENTDPERDMDEVNMKASYFNQSWDALNKCNNKQIEHDIETSSAKWNFEKTINISPKQETSQKDITILDDIMKRINTINNPEYSNYLKLLKEKLAKSTNQANSNLTKSKHTICTNFSAAKSPPDYIFDTSQSKTAWSANKSDLKPIGAKPASMFTISSSSNRKQLPSSANNTFNSISVPVNKKPQQKKIQTASLIKSIFTPSIWANNDSKALKKSSYSFISPFITYNENDEFKRGFNKLKTNVQLAADTPAFKPRQFSNLCLLNDQSHLKQTKLNGSKYRSVAPLAMQQQQPQQHHQQSQYQKYQKPYYQKQQQQQYFPKLSKTVYSSDIYTCLEASLFQQSNAKKSFY